ncbi:hypothetical protein, unlikely [Trypanosoma brucei brucei TREU927]|uniref:Uncharacterized protein n=1 Tax=Trypanosoma brucei brucei (strain 927/4 GUTat10.1) TaxID=185431 RepID=Q38DU0_TRYB2|nr:hypothetical protein, unlikely [Trypanosoma brucei brucei TREU927]EAN77030.1 hypothetical protein, unlikely [Trypanosoma brucei brucei TREU927]
MLQAISPLACFCVPLLSVLRPLQNRDRSALPRRNAEAGYSRRKTGVTRRSGVFCLDDASVDIGCLNNWCSNHVPFATSLLPSFGISSLQEKEVS